MLWFGLVMDWLVFALHSLASCTLLIRGFADRCGMDFATRAFSVSISS